MGRLSTAVFLCLFVASFAMAQLSSNDATTLYLLSDHWVNMATGPNPWIQSTLGNACTQWRGISCSPSPTEPTTLRVTSIDLKGENLAAPFPNATFLLDALQVLDLSSTGTYGPLTGNWSSLADLVQLNLSQNTLDGTIPPSIGSLSRLQVLKLDSNRLSGTVPDTLRQLTSLRFLNVTGNSIRGLLTSWFENWLELEVFSASTAFLWMWNGQFAVSPNISLCQKLRVLELGSPSVQLPFPPEMDQLVNLEIFDFSFAQLDAFPNVLRLPKLKTLMGGFIWWKPIPIPDKLAMPSLETLVLMSGLNGTIPPSIGNLVELKTLSLSSLKLSGSLPDSIGSLTKLRNLDISFNPGLGGDIPSAIGNLVELESLRISRCSFTSLPESIGNLTSLFLLDVSGNQITQWPSTIGNLRELRVLLTPGNNMTGPLHSGIGQLTKLERLDIGANRFTSVPDLSQLTRMTSFAAPTAFVRGLPFPVSVKVFSNIAALNMAANGFVGTIPHDFFAGCVGLRTLLLSVNQLSGTIPSSIMELRNLTHLDLSRNQFEGTPPDLSGLKLKQLVLSYNRLSGSVPTWMANLTELSVPLGLRNNLFSGSLPDAFGTMNAAISLDLARNQLTGGLPSTLSNKSLLTGIDVSFNAMRLCPTNVTSIPSFLGCRLHNQNVSDYDCGCDSTIFSQCRTSPKELKKCVPCESGAPPSNDLTWQCRDGYWFYNAFLGSLPSPYVSSTGIHSSVFEMVVTASGNAYSNHIELHESSAALMGNLTVQKLTFHGVRAFLNVSRCLTVTSISIVLSDEDVDTLKGNNGILPAPLITFGTEFNFNASSSCSENTLSRVPAAIQQAAHSCTKFSLKPSLGAIFASQFAIDESGCGKKQSSLWWHIVVGTVCGVLLLVVIVILLAFVKGPIRNHLRPHKRSSRKTFD